MSPDTVDGFLMAAASAKAVGQTINVGSGKEISIGNLAKLIASWWESNPN